MQDLVSFTSFVGQNPPRFADPAELECARLFDYHGIPWEYEPHTFVLQSAADGTVIEAFTPDFYLPEQDLYLEITTMKQSLVTRKNRKVRQLRALHPEIRIKLFYKRDVEALAQKYELDAA
jgi:hypoxanthine phosphoribosyltransferase